MIKDNSAPFMPTPEPPPEPFVPEPMQRSVFETLCFDVKKACIMAKLAEKGEIAIPTQILEILVDVYYGRIELEGPGGFGMAMAKAPEPEEEPSIIQPGGAGLFSPGQGLEAVKVFKGVGVQDIIPG